MVGQHHRFNGHEFEQTPGDTEGQGSLVCWVLGFQRVGHYLATQQDQTRSQTTSTEVNINALSIFLKDLTKVEHALSSHQKSKLFRP